MNFRVVILDVCVKELRKFPIEIKRDLLAVVEQLDRGVKLMMPLSRPMPSIGNGVHELRMKDRSGQYRIVYCYFGGSGEIYFVHAFAKKTQATPKRNIDLAKKRLRSLK